MRRLIFLALAMVLTLQVVWMAVGCQQKAPEKPKGEAVKPAEAPAPAAPAATPAPAAPEPAKEQPKK